MNPMRITGLLTMVVGIAMATGAVGVSLGQETAETALMAAKSRYAHALLDAVIAEDFDAIRDQALRLKAVAETADWKASESAAYVRVGESFVRAADDLMHAAQERSGDGAALAYMDLTMKCVQCHRFLRNRDRP